MSVYILAVGGYVFGLGVATLIAIWAFDEQERAWYLDWGKKYARESARSRRS